MCTLDGNSFTLGDYVIITDPHMYGVKGKITRIPEKGGNVYEVTLSNHYTLRYSTIAKQMHHTYH